jgi:RpiR family carbohydrate utilization transcriptional regulator
MSGNWGESTVMARLRAGSPQLGPSERRVASVILARPDDVTDWSTSELAAAADTSAATVIRACQSLGFRGFQHLRLELARAAPGLPVASDDPVGALFDEAVDALRLGRESVDPAAIEQAVGALEGAHRLVLVGNGFSAPPLQDAALRFSTSGAPWRPRATFSHNNLPPIPSDRGTSASPSVTRARTCTPSRPAARRPIVVPP